MIKYIAPALAGVALLCLVLIYAMAGDVPALIKCFISQDVMDYLTKSLGAKPIGQGVRQSGELVHLWKTDKDIFTVVLINPNGVACYLAGGDGWTNDITDLNKDKGI